MTAILQIDTVSKRFGTVVTADGISFEVEQGTALGIVGPNGAGKSTLLSLITGIEPVDSGRVLFRGEDVTRSSTMVRTRAGVARTFQIPRPFTAMTVFENVQVGAAFGGGKQNKASYDAAIRALEITGLIDKSEQRAGQLRLLDRKRLELARALATDPSLILLDEIAGGLTDHELPPLIELIQSLKDSGVTIIWIEHIVHALTKVVDELMCLALGRILARGLPEEVMSNADVIDIYMGSTVDEGKHA